MNHYFVFETAHGFAALGWNATGVSALRLPAATPEDARRALLRRLPDAIESKPAARVSALVASIGRYFAGERIDFSDVPVDLGAQHALNREIYALVRRLGWGETTSYGAIASALGKGPEVARDVGQAMAHNPVPLIVPCHRVLAAGGKIGGFSAPGGSNAKARMLAMEGVQPAPAVADKSAGQASFGF